MEITTLYSWEELKNWCDQRSILKQYVFRGQSDNTWPLRTSLARHFIANKIKSEEWRPRELKMYRMFRERLLNLCPGMYENWSPMDVLSLMQHHGTPTRLLDFTSSPLVASYFALRDARGDSAIWVINTDYLEALHRSKGFEYYSGPTHIDNYKIAQKNPSAIILTPSSPHLRLASQHGCFLVPGRILSEVDAGFIDSKVILSENLVMDSVIKLRGLGIDNESMFPNLDKIAEEINRFSVTGGAEFPAVRPKKS
ncbi:MAG: FRG domain-containing protein [Anaerolineales bacterium]|nr:FRG domain-containing protein [Anaerolineales bacterium]